MTEGYYEIARHVLLAWMTYLLVAYACTSALRFAMALRDGSAATVSTGYIALLAALIVYTSVM